MTDHELKSWPEFFAGLADGTKTAEVRRNDRHFQVGDHLVLREFEIDDEETGHYTGRVEKRLITRVDDLGLVAGAGFVLLSFAETRYGGELAKALTRIQTIESVLGDIAESLAKAARDMPELRLDERAEAVLREEDEQ